VTGNSMNASSRAFAWLVVASVVGVALTLVSYRSPAVHDVSGALGALIALVCGAFFGRSTEARSAAVWGGALIGGGSALVAIGVGVGLGISAWTIFALGTFGGTASGIVGSLIARAVTTRASPSRVGA
jgi:hypothetical protein